MKESVIHLQSRRINSIAPGKVYHILQFLCLLEVVVFLLGGTGLLSFALRRYWVHELKSAHSVKQHSSVMGRSDFRWRAE